MRIALDAMGTDAAPRSEVAGAVVALEADSSLELALVGDETLISEALTEQPGADAVRDRIQLVHAPERIRSGERPAKVLRRRPGSSISVGLKLVKRGEANAFVSAGSTGAVMAGSLLILGALAGVARPSVGALLPTSGGPTLLLDAGANIECKPHHLVQFAHLGAVYMKDLCGVAEPRIGLLNVGVEAVKGTEVVRDSHTLLAASDLNFVGNVEGRDIIGHRCDVLVCDGFTGNILLKFYESVAGFVESNFRSIMDPGQMDPRIEEVFRVFDYTEHGGAQLLGVNGVSVVCHGESPPRAIANAIAGAARAVQSRIVAHVADLSPAEMAVADESVVEAPLAGQSAVGQLPVDKSPVNLASKA